MRLLADENMPREAVEALRVEGYDILWMQTQSPGLSDEEILDRAVDEGRVVLTFDKDFGELAFHIGSPAGCGIILFRIPMRSPQEVARIVRDVVTARDDWSSHFSVVEEQRIRIRRLPGK